MRFNKRKISISDEFDVFDLEPWKNVSSNSIKEKMISPK